MNRDYLKHLGFATATAIAATKQTEMTLPQETIEKIKADAKAYMHNEIKGMVGDEELQPYHLQYAHEAGATEWAGRAEGLVTALEWIKTYGPCDERTIKFINNALAKYKEVENG